jgi:hypothetical protein
MDTSGGHLNDRPVNITYRILPILHPNIFEGLMALPVFLLVKKLNT